MIGYATIVGLRLGNQTEACERQEISFELDESGRLDIDRLVNIGPVTASVVAARLAIFDAAEGGKEIGWFQPPPGAGKHGTYVVLQSGQEITQ